jgi:hypothetical protein
MGLLSAFAYTKPLSASTLADNGFRYPSVWIADAGSWYPPSCTPLTSSIWNIWYVNQTHHSSKTEYFASDQV